MNYTQLHLIMRKIQGRLFPNEHQRGHGVPHVRVVVDRHAAHVELDDARFEGMEFFGLVGESVVNAKHSLGSLVVG